MVSVFERSKNDIYSFGSIVYTMATGGNIYGESLKSMSVETFLNKLRDGTLKPVDSFQKLEKCLNENPDERPTWDEIIRTLEVMY